VCVCVCVCVCTQCARIHACLNECKRLSTMILYEWL